MSDILLVKSCKFANTSGAWRTAQYYFILDDAIAK